MVICSSAVILLVLCGITMRGTLSTTCTQRMMLSGDRKIHRNIKLEDLSLPSTTKLPEIQPSASHKIDGPDEHTEMPGVSEATMAQWKAIEMFKV